MNNLKHTPGSWIYEHKPFIGKFLILSESGDVLASINNSTHELPLYEQEANAKLIAAAPNLLQACINVIDALHPLHDMALQSVIDRFLLPAIKKATE